MKKKVALGAAAVALVGTLAVGGTLAWFTDTETATNVVTVGNVDISWFEKGPGAATASEITKTNTGVQYGETIPVTPGATLTKEAKVKNKGKNAAYIRAQIQYVNKAGNTVEKPNYLTYDLAENTKWVEKDGYYYYTEIVQSNEYTELLLKNLKIESAATNGQLADQDFKVVLVAEAIQSDNVTFSGGGTMAEKLATLFGNTTIYDYES